MAKHINNYLSNCNVYQPKLPLDYTFEFEKELGQEDITRTVCEAAEEAELIKYVSFKNRDAHGYDSFMMLKCVMLAMTLDGYCSTRELEEHCKYDARFIYITHGEKPSHMAFQRFIHDDLTESIEDIFYALNKWIEKKDDINTDILFIDGTKYEANANKMSFVWMNATKKFRARCWRKVMDELVKLNRYCEENSINVRFSILKEISPDYLMKVCETIEKIAEENGIEFVNGKGKRKTELQRMYDNFKDYAVKMYKYQIHFDIAGNRNSFSKTDPDATFMHMKYDYYNHTNVFKPGYNVQMGISDGYIRHVYTSSDANDLHTYIPFMESYYRAYGEYPSKTPADAGYGSYDNYYFCKLNRIDLMMKYSGQRKKSEKITDKNRFKQWNFKLTEEGTYICPAGHEFHTVSVRLEQRGAYPRLQETLKCDHCSDCPFKSKCTKSKTGRTLHRCRQLEHWQDEVDQNLSTDEGQELMKQRSILSEGKFGDLKENWDFDKLHRRGNTGVKTEILLVSIGSNLRRYHTRKYSKEQEEQKLQFS